jgi:hypothetical protein
VAQKQAQGEPPRRSDEPSRRTADTTEITRELVDELGAKLDRFANDLSADERMALHAALALTSRAFRTLVTGVACEGGLRIGIGRSAVLVEPIGGKLNPSLSDTLTGAFCGGSVSSRFGIEGLDVERSVSGAKSVAAAGAKSVAAGSPWVAGAKSTAATGNLGAVGAKSVAACRNPALYGAKSVAACRMPWGAAVANPALVGAKSVAACRMPWGAAVANPNLIGAKSVAACRNPGLAGAKSVAACRNPGLAGAKSVAACRMPGALTYY